MGDIVLYLPDN